MNCLECNTWNPDDKDVCWRCQTELPKPEAPKPKRQTWGGMPVWVWIALVVFFVATSFVQCSFMPSV